MVGVDAGWGRWVERDGGSEKNASGNHRMGMSVFYVEHHVPGHQRSEAGVPRGTLDRLLPNPQLSLNL